MSIPVCSPLFDWVLSGVFTGGWRGSNLTWTLIFPDGKSGAIYIFTLVEK
jgi:hypothetical protein